MATAEFAAVFASLPTDQGIAAFELLRRPEASYAGYRQLGWTGAGETVPDAAALNERCASFRIHDACP